MFPVHFRPPRHALTVFIGILGCGMLVACAPTASSQPTAKNSAVLQSASPMAELQQAMALDEAELQDLTLSVNRRGDLLDHQISASNAMRDLQAGIPVSADRLEYALEVPPAHLTSAQRSSLIDRLQQAIRQDESREQGVLAFGGSNIFYQDPDAPTEFGGQEELAQKELVELQSGEHVSWDAVQQALYVPPDPL